MIALFLFSVLENYSIIEEDGRYWISKEASCPSGDIEIPEKDRDGNTITGIYAYGFCQCDEITSVKLPGTIEEIGSRAFASIDIPPSVTQIGLRAFPDNCEVMRE